MQSPIIRNDVAIFLDLDNVIIAAGEARLVFDVNIVLDYIKTSTGGRIVLRRGYGDWRQNPDLMRQVASAGFELQSAVRLNNMSKNLADMQLVVDAVETLIDGYSFETYVLVTGDRDFMPLVQTLRKRGKHVVGVGVRHATSTSLANLCDEYVFYDDLADVRRQLTRNEMREWLVQAVDELLQKRSRVRASVMRQHLDEISAGEFASSEQSKMSFSKLLEQYPDLIALEHEGSTLYVKRPQATIDDLPRSYRSALKRHGLRVVPLSTRLHVIKDVIAYLQHADETHWQKVVEFLSKFYADKGEQVSKSHINDVLRVARRAKVIAVESNGNKPLSALAVTLAIEGENLFKQAVMRCDAAYLCEIKNFADLPFDMDQAAIALYDSTSYTPYIRLIFDQFCAGSDKT
ncbi:MAG: NYN domain-containing protein [Anaerolineae bacterium]|nr:NYN domain-containing protein [Anaerolineae bacterium]MCO5193697.1 NYN domain-containing protein [Anaerolineae bacterium]MCO5206569.1 NYN domain-containing protein [Anaerolineae bacterium]